MTYDNIVWPDHKDSYNDIMNDFTMLPLISAKDT